MQTVENIECPMCPENPYVKIGTINNLVSFINRGNFNWNRPYTWWEW